MKLSLLLIISSFFLLVNCSSENNGRDNNITQLLYSCSCLRGCSTHAISIGKDRTYLYLGRFNTPYKGAYEGKLPEEYWKKLIASLEINKISEYKVLNYSIEFDPSYSHGKDCYLEMISDTDTVKVKSDIFPVELRKFFILMDSSYHLASLKPTSDTAQFSKLEAILPKVKTVKYNLKDSTTANTALPNKKH